MLKYDSSSREVRLTVDRDYQEGTHAYRTYLLHSVTRLSAMLHAVVQHACA